MLRSGRWTFFYFLQVIISLTSKGQEIRTASIFTDHMVIQKGINAPVWGYAPPGSIVTVDFAGYQTKAKADSAGKWMSKIPILDYGGPYDMKVFSRDTIVLKDVMVGEVWLASGQSNMEWSVGMGIGPDTEKEIATAQHESIRYFVVPHKTSVVPLENTEKSQWQRVSPETVRHLSAVAYFFARDLHQHRKVAVGIISSSWGATSAHAWISREMLATHPDFREPVSKLTLDNRQWEETVRQHHENDRIRDSLASAALIGIKTGVPAISYADSNWKTAEYPLTLEKAGKPGFWGISWFRKSFDMPASAADRKAVVRIFLRGHESQIFLNGKLIGKVNNTEQEMSFNVPAKLMREGRNVLTVRLYQHWGVGLVGLERYDPIVETADKKTKISLRGAWLCNNDIEPLIPQMQGYYNQLTVQYNARIAPVIPYGIKGVIWYQGEGNASKAYQYRTLFPLVIQDWRMRWQQGIFPFLFVQLANNKEKKTKPADDAVAELREAQTMTLAQPATGMACAIDLGDPLDIHPRNKLDVGKRLYLSARSVAYGEQLVSSGPLYVSSKVEGNKIRISFSSVGNGLMIKNGTALKGFSMCGSDRIFRWADATIEGESIVVKCPEIEKPEAVRYAWESNPDGNLYNLEGLPAVPFRTDRYKMVTE
jgi:sialate O-acetylesterase